MPSQPCRSRCCSDMSTSVCSPPSVTAVACRSRLESEVQCERCASAPSPTCVEPESARLCSAGMRRPRPRKEASSRPSQRSRARRRSEGSGPSAPQCGSVTLGRSCRPRLVSAPRRERCARRVRWGVAPRCKLSSLGSAAASAASVSSPRWVGQSRRSSVRVGCRQPATSASCSAPSERQSMCSTRNLYHARTAPGRHTPAMLGAFMYSSCRLRPMRPQPSRCTPRWSMSGTSRMSRWCRNSREMFMNASLVHRLQPRALRDFRSSRPIVRWLRMKSDARCRPLMSSSVMVPRRETMLSAKSDRPGHPLMLREVRQVSLGHTISIEMSDSRRQLERSSLRRRGKHGIGMSAGRLPQCGKL
mmetsp:Transcript_40995/g.104857  ORF Transcript_40995/g.104857 Transcript_40995/m.104857 type:complete len:360 (-) Transcript_40995:189-1268(-)